MLALWRMMKFYDYKAMKIPCSAMWSGILKMEEMCLEYFFGRFGANSLSKSANIFYTQNWQLNASVGGNRITFAILEREKQT
jgi:hypothetical protein